FSKYAHPAVLTDPLFPPKFQEAILVAAGYKPGRSTDWVAVKLAQHYGAKKVINLTNIDHVYDRDPRKSRNAKPLKNISWTIYRKIAGSRWSPGLSLPFDPVASKLAQSEGIEVDIINGKKLQQVQRALEGKAFKGTRIF
ncbi:MAG TPA: UMP kinase, partial [Patescibacteria group bacterium]|nr:UMP kinase [Patescibacteria group bacterium]